MAQAAAQISEEYRSMQTKLHENPNYGVASVQYAPIVAQIIQQLQVTELLDYGAGKGRLGQTLATLLKQPLTVHHYDPAIPEWAGAPKPCGMVCCIDVLEHIEPEFLDNVLDHLQSLVGRVGFFTVHIGPAIKVLPDGRNAHLIQEPSSWWLPKMMERFELNHFQRVPQGFWVLVEKKPEQPATPQPV
jgi:2-polyprenyl-3-methyl-5-hydroxy-6-metoxy-1,4-benzoquinol methylase